MSVDALIPARRGSRRLPGKHLLALGGRPLARWTAQAALEADCFRRVTLSSDDEELRAQAADWGLDPFPARPAALARDDSPSVAVVRHYLDWLDEAGEGLPEWLMLLQPTSPFRGPARIREALELAVAARRDLVSLGPVDKPLAWCRRLEEGEARPWVCPAPAPAWRLNGAIYLLRVERFLVDGALLPERPLALAMADWESVDIDTPLDWLLAQAVAAERGATGEARP